jgi:pimeloyl-ACP methyl ester carboxylesterase
MGVAPLEELPDPLTLVHTSRLAHPTAPPHLLRPGEGDRLNVDGEGPLLVAAIPGSRLIVYEHTGHLVLWEQPERVATDLADFVAGLST